MTSDYDLLVSRSLDSYQVKSGGSEVMNVTMMANMVVIVVVPCFHRS
jgi:hypothetical protein